LASEHLSPEKLPAGTRLACRIEYHGGVYSGWQSQAQGHVTTVQDLLEAALSAVADEKIRVFCAGRTDTGVHAHCQIFHFEAPVARSPKSWVFGGNTHLPRDIRIHWLVPVAEDFHARFSAHSRSYRYIIENTLVHSAILSGAVTWHRKSLDVSTMHTAAQALLGKKDFSAFRAASCQSNSPVRDVQAVSVRRRGDLVALDIQANAFLHHMVRNIAGALMMVGEGRQPVSWVEELLVGKDRTVAADTAAASGLYLIDVRYPDSFGLPKTPAGPALFGPL
jgi:tRNA pseudouridine38-40 synthase